MHFMFSINISYTNFGTEVAHYYVMTEGFLVHGSLLFVEHLHCLVVMVVWRGIDLYDS